jgi:hypothetical protein
MKINLAHLRERSTSGGWINFAVFDARSSSGSSTDNANLLSQLAAKARMSGLQVDQSALAYSQGGQIRFYGDKNLVSYLSQNFVPQWTHTIEV